MSSFVSALRASQTVDSTFKYETDSVARIVIPSDEGATATKVRLTSISSYYRMIRKKEWTPDAEVGANGCITDGRSEAIVTPKRVVIWSPLSTGMFGGPKEKPGRATGGVMPLNMIDQIERDGRLGLMFRVDAGDVLTDGMALSLEFADATGARQFSSALASVVPAFWAGEAKSAKSMLALGLYGPDSSNKLYRMMGESFTKKAAVDVAKVEAEMAKLGDLDWADAKAPLSISLARVGVPF